MSNASVILLGADNGTDDIFGNYNTTESLNATLKVDDSGSNGLLIAYLMLCFCLGCPLNIYTLLILRRKLARSGSHTTSRTTYLKLHLSISDMLVLNFLGLWRAVYEAVQFWHGGAFLCKFFKFGQALGLELSSAIIVCIAFDRLLFLVRPFTPYTKALKRTKSLIYFAWGYALVFSFPQILAFQLFDMPEHPQSPQCVFWYYCKLHYKHKRTALDEHLFVAHNFSHMITSFWLPAVLMIIFYLGILWHIWRRYRFPGKQNEPLNSTYVDSEEQQSSSIHLQNYIVPPVLDAPLGNMNRTFPDGAALTGPAPVLAIDPMPGANGTVPNGMVQKRSAQAQPQAAARHVEEELTSGPPELVEDSTTGCPELVPSSNAPSEIREAFLNSQAMSLQPLVPLIQRAVSFREEEITNCDSMPELVASSFGQEEGHFEVIQLMPCLMDFRESTTGDENKPPQPKRKQSSQTASRTARSRDITSSRQSAYKKDQLTRLPARTTKTTVILINAYLVCWTPICVNLLWGYIDPSSWVSSAKVFRFVQLLIVFNSVLNPLIYEISIRQLCRNFFNSKPVGLLTSKCAQAKSIMAQRIPYHLLGNSCSCFKKPQESPIAVSRNEVEGEPAVVVRMSNLDITKPPSDSSIS